MENCSKSGGIILSAEVMTPIGSLTLRSCRQGFHSIKSDSDSASKQHFPPKDSNQRRTGPVQISKFATIEYNTDQDGFSEAKTNLDAQILWIQNYFQNPAGTQSKESDGIGFSNFCFDNGVTDFEVTVWKALFENVKSGHTISYGKLAETIDNPKAARAVGTALKKNPILLMIPCHRIIRSDGSLGKFAGGTWNDCKGFLQQHENRSEP